MHMCMVTQDEDLMIQYLSSISSDENLLPFQNYHYCLGQYVANLTEDEMLDFTHEPLLIHLGRDPGEKFVLE